MTEEQLSLINRLEKAITSLEVLEQTDLVKKSITNLKEKKQLVLDNNYSIRQVNEDAIRFIGGQIAGLTKLHWTKELKYKRNTTND